MKATNNERGAGRKQIDGKTRYLKATDEELAEIKKLLLEIRKTAKENEKLR